MCVQVGTISVSSTPHLLRYKHIHIQAAILQEKGETTNGLFSQIAAVINLQS